MRQKFPGLAAAEPDLYFVGGTAGREAYLEVRGERFWAADAAVGLRDAMALGEDSQQPCGLSGGRRRKLVVLYVDRPDDIADRKSEKGRLIAHVEPGGGIDLRA